MQAFFLQDTKYVLAAFDIALSESIFQEFCNGRFRLVAI